MMAKIIMALLKKKDQKMFKNDELVVRAVSLHPKQFENENGFLFPLQFIKNLGW